jgi:DNA-binding CsgD family transcriptional regulator
MELHPLTLIDLHKRTTVWLKEFLSAAHLDFRIKTAQEFLEGGLDAPAILLYLDPLRNWSNLFLESISNAGYAGSVIGWIPGETLHTEHVLSLLNRNVHAILPDFYSPEEAAAAILQCRNTGYHYNHLICEALMHICRKNGTVRNKNVTTILNERETVAVDLRAEGRSAYEIAAALHVSKAAIDKLFFRLYQRTGFRNFFELYAALRKERAIHFPAGSAEPFPATNSFK